MIDNWWRRLSRIGHKRGNDGLTDAERRASANRWRNGAGRALSKEEMDEIRRLTAQQREGER